MKTFLELMLCAILTALSPNETEAAGNMALLYPDSIVSKPEGFAAAAGINGGSGGKSIVVVNLNDSGPGSLRDALNSPGPRIVTFSFGLTGTIKSPGGLFYGDVTLDGAGAKITITGGSIFIAKSATKGPISNCIIKNLTFGNTKADKSAITIVNPAHTVWIDHCTFYDNSSGFLGQPIAVWSDPVGEGITGISVSWCHFKTPNRKALLIGAADQILKKTTRVSFHHNWFDGVDSRSPRIGAGTLAHGWNNYLSNWTEYGVGASAYADLLLENNIFESASNIYGVVTNYNGPYASSVNESGSYIIGAPKLQTVGTFPKDQLTYKANLEVADDALKSRIMVGAGAP
ncbi:MAG: hypothetical protein M0R39_05405 [Prolixibacteraceae bacterium]|nr:hypothetical protein [Prolixibacteraceae bacterium]